MKNRKDVIKKVYVRKVSRVITGFDRANKFSVLELEEYKEDVEKMYKNFQLITKHIENINDAELIKKYIAQIDETMFRSKKVKVRDGLISKNKFDATRKYALIYLDNIKKLNQHLDTVLKQGS